jgi:hypothetical protein
MSVSLLAFKDEIGVLSFTNGQTTDITLEIILHNQQQRFITGFN